jgi:hypothetical protein
MSSTTTTIGSGLLTKVSSSTLVMITSMIGISVESLTWTAVAPMMGFTGAFNVVGNITQNGQQVMVV